MTLGVPCVLASTLGAGGQLAVAAPVKAPGGPESAAAVTPRAGTAVSSAINAVHVTSASDVWAVGSQFANDQVGTLIEHWDGQLWEVVPSPSPGAGSGARPVLRGVTATSATNAWAVGNTTDFATGEQRPLIEHWNGSSWAEVPSPNPGLPSVLTGVAITSVSYAWAVGTETDASGNDTPLIEHWDGGLWTIMQAPAFGVDSQLASVTARSATDVWAVGNTRDPATGNIATLTGHWDGTAWTVKPSTSPSLAGNRLASVAATAADDAWAVGTQGSNSSPSTLIEHWDGKVWHDVPSPNPQDGRNILTSVTATSATDVWAVGTAVQSASTSDSGSEESTPLIVHWDGTAWQVVRSPAVPGDGGLPANAEFTAVAATSPANAWAIGANGSSETLSEHWNGTSWAIVATRNPGTFNRFNAVAATSATNAWAVGLTAPEVVSPNGTPGESGTALVEHWDGTSWTEVPRPTAGSSSEFLAVAARTAADAWAVGATNGDTGTSTLIEHWDGRAWTIVPSPSPRPLGGVAALTSVAVTSATDAWAVGYTAFSFAPIAPLIEHWDGTSWTVKPIDVTTGQVLSVAATSATDAWAVVNNTDVAGGTVPVIEHWDGTAWSVSPRVAFGNNRKLVSLAATSPTDVWAAGFIHPGSGSTSTLTERFDGTGWGAVQNPGTPQDSGTALTGVTATSATNAWAVGSAPGPTPAGQPLIERWNGAAWAVVAGATVTPPGATLSAVAATSASNAWAVGSVPVGASSGSFIERWNGSAWKAVPSPDVSF